jgi:hypothetical protein
VLQCLVQSQAGTEGPPTTGEVCPPPREMSPKVCRWAHLDAAPWRHRARPEACAPWPADGSG